MKKSIILGLLSLAAAGASAFGQGLIFLDNYNTGGPNVLYGASVPQNGVSGALGTLGNPINSPTGWTMGFYWVAGNVLGSIAADPTGVADPSTLGGGLAVASGGGSSATIDGGTTFNTPGQALAGSSYTTAGVATGGTITVMAVGYSGGSYASANYRGHSTAFTMTVSDPTSPSPNKIGAFMSGFSVLPVPEPSIFALSGLGAAALMLIRRKK
jgi:hypothetical protein